MHGNQLLLLARFLVMLVISVSFAVCIMCVIQSINGEGEQPARLHNPESVTENRVESAQVLQCLRSNNDVEVTLTRRGQIASQILPGPRPSSTIREHAVHAACARRESMGSYSLILVRDPPQRPCLLKALPSQRPPILMDGSGSYFKCPRLCRKRYGMMNVYKYTICRMRTRASRAAVASQR